MAGSWESEPWLGHAKILSADLLKYQITILREIAMLCSVVLRGTWHFLFRFTLLGLRMGAVLLWGS